MNNESTKWLYDNLTAKGYNVGKDLAEFDSLMVNNEESRKWAFETAGQLGYNVGKDYDEFSSLVAPKMTEDALDAAPMGDTPVPFRPQETEEIEDLRAEKKRLEGLLGETRLKADERRKAISTNAGAFQFGMAPITGNAANEISDKELTKYSATENELNEAIREVDRRILGEKPGFWQGMMDATLRNPSFYTLGLSDMADSRAKLDISENGIKDDTDRALADAIYTNSQLQETSDKGFLYRAGNMFGHSIPFMVEMAATGGFSGVSNLGKKAVKEGVEESVKQKVRRMTGVVADDFIEAAMIANTAGAASTQANILDRKAGTLKKDGDGDFYFDNKESWLEAAYKGEMSSVLEMYSEKLGNHLDGKLSLAKGLDKLGAKKISKALTVAQGNDLMKAATTVMKQFGLNSVLPEVLEEEANIVLNGLLVDSNEFNKLFDLQTQADIIGGMYLTVGTMRAIPGAIGSVGYFKNQRNLNKAEKEAEEVFGEAWNGISEELNNASNEDVSKVLAKKMDDVKAESKPTLLNYYKQMMIMRGYNIGSTKRESDTAGVEYAYQEAYSVEPTGETATRIIDDLRKAEDAVRVALNLDKSDDVDAFVNNISAEKLANGDEGIINAVNGYKVAKARFEGVSDNVKDNVEQESQESDKVIQERINKTDGMVYSTTLHGGERVFITGGTVVLDDEGYIDVANSGDLWALYPDGTKKQLREGDLREKVEVFNTDELKATERAMIEELWRDKLNTFTYNDNQGEHVITVKQTNGEISRAVVDGVEQDVPTRFINELKDKIVQKSPVADNTAEVATETPAAGNTQTMIEPIPTETRGKVKRTAYHVVPIERTLEDLESNELTEDEKIQFAQANIDEINSELQKVLKQEPKMGADIQAYKAAKAQWTVARDEWQKRLGYYNELLNRLKQPVQTSEITPAVEGVVPQATNKIQPVRKVVSKKKAAPEMPETVDEFVASVMPKITPESFKRETGLSNGEQRQLVGYIAGKGKGGITIEQAAESIVANYNDELLGLGFTGDEQDVRDMIINILSNGNPKGYIKRSRALREAELSQQERQMADVWAEGMGFDSYENYLDYTESLLEDIEERRKEFDETEYYNNLAENYEYDTTGERKDFGRGGELLQGEQFVTTTPSEVIGEGYEGTAVPGDVRGGGDNALTQGETRQVNTVNDESVAEGENAPGQSDVGKIQESRSVEEVLENGDKRITNYNSRGEVATVATERDGKIVSVDSYDEGVLFEHTEYDGNGKAAMVTRYDKSGNVVGTQEYVNGIESKAYVREVMRTAPLHKRAEKWMKDTGVPVRLISIGDEITNSAARKAIEAGEKVTGWIDNNEVVLYLPNIGNAKEIDDTFVHEVVAHKGLKALMGKDFDALCDKVWEIMSEEQRAYYMDYPGVNGDTRKAADEYMAHLAEGVDLTDADKTVWQRIVEAVREFLVKHGMRMTDKDIENLIKASYSNLKAESGKGETGSKENAKLTKAEKYRKMREDLEGLGVFGEVALPKGYKWSDGKMYGGKGGRRRDASSVTALVIGDDLYLRDNQKMGGIVPFVNLNNKNHQTAVIRNFRQWPSIGDFMTAILDVGYQFDRVTEDAINEIFTQNGIGFNRRILRPMFRIAEVNERFNRELQQQIDGTLPKGHVYELGMPSEVLMATGIPELPIQLNSTKLQEKSTSYGHDYSLEEIKDLVNALHNPLAVFAYGDKTKAQNIVVEIQSNDKNFVIGLALRPKVGGRVLEINSIRNVFPKDNAEWLNWIAQGKALYLDKERIQTLIDQQRTNLADVDYLDLNSIANVINNFENPTIESENTSENPQESESGIRFRRVTDPAKIAELEAGEKMKVYRAMQVIDGKLYPPMSAKVDGKLREPIELGVWEEAEERPELADDKGYFKLEKGNKKSLKARYNPYIHTSTTPLNDQFSEAQDRPNLVTVEVEIPVSELSSGYKADKAKDAVGRIEWKAGVVQGKLSGTRTVVLSRWDKPVRIVPDSEVADVIVEMFGDRDITMPSNVVTPSLRAELEKRGVPFVETDNQGKPVEEHTMFRRVTPEMDAEYMDAVENGDMETAERLVKEAAKLAMPETKVVDEDGYPMVVYHGSEEGFNVFDKTKGRANMDIQGMFFSPWDDDARGYGSNVRAFYLNITKPANESTGYKALNKFQGQNGAGIKAREYLISAGYDGVNNEDQEFVAFDANQIKSADAVTYDDNGNVIPLSERFNEEKEDIRFRVANQNQEIFVSNAQRAVEGIKQEKATPEQWLAMLQKNGGLKAGEDMWLGLSEWLNGKQGSVTKQEILEFIGENKIQIEEVNYAGGGEQMENYRGLLEKSKGKAFTDRFLRAFDIEYDEFGIFDEQEAIDLYNEANGTDMQLDEDGYWNDGDDMQTIIDWAESVLKDARGDVREIHRTRIQYTTEGLENKREIALVVPTVESYNIGDYTHFGDAGEGRAIAWIRFGEKEVTVQDATQQRLNEINDRLAEFGMRLYSTGITEDEYNERERLVRERDELQEIEPKTQRVLVIDEIQSKRHQDGREKGYRGVGLAKEILAAEEEVRKTNRELTAYREPLKEKYNFRELGSSMSERLKNFDAMLSEEENATIDALGNARNEAEKRLQELREQGRGVPSAPFEKNWHELAMKRMLRLAAEEGFDKVAWTTGEQQAERYNLGKAFNDIEREDNPGIEGRRFVLNGANVETFQVDENGNIIDSTIEEAKNKPLADVVGKDMAVKMMSLENGDMLEGEDLRVGGEGMKGFYDRMLPSFVQKYTKKWGAKVGEVTMPNLGENNTMHSVDVTPEMQESVMEGQTMFRKNDARKGWNIENEDVTLHKTKDGRIVRYEQLDLFNNNERAVTDIQRNTSEGNGNANNGAGNDNLQRDNLAGGNSIAQINVPLRPLEKGEMSLVQRIFTKSKAFDFTAGEQIESLEDVAYIFKNLEDESIENSFAVLVKDGRPMVLHLGMGGYTSTIVNATAVAVAMENVKPDKVYFVHNHPSGALKASANDVEVLQKLRTNYGDIVEKGIIINLKSGKFGVYDVAQATSEVRDEKTGDGLEVPVEIFTFNKQVFDKDFNPSELFQIHDADDIAAFISSNRLGDRNKIGLLVCNNQLKVVGNVFTPYIGINSAAAQKIAKDVVYYTTVMGGNRPILFGRFPALSRTAKSNLEFYINSYSGGQIKLVDLVDVESSESVLNEEGAFYGDITKGNAVERVNLGEPEGGSLFREGETATKKEKQAILKENAKAIRRLHNVRATFPITALRNLRHALETEQERLEHDRLFAVRDGLVDNADMPVSIEVNPQGMTLQERITESLLKLANDNRENVETRLAAIRAYSGSLDNVLKLMRAQKGYDKKTVDMFVGLVKMYLRNNAVKGMSNYDIYRLLGLINRASGGYRMRVNRAAEQIVEIITKGHVRELQETMNRMLKTGAEKVNASGVVVQGGVDIVGKRKLNSFRDAIVMSQEAFEEKMAKIQEKVAKNPEDAEALAELDAMYLAQQYKEKVADSKADEEELLRQVAADSEMRGLLNRGVISRRTYNEFADGVRRNVIELRTRRIDEMQKILRALAGDISEGMLAAKEFRERELAKRMEIHDIAEADLKGVSKAAFKSQKASKAMDWFVYKNPIVKGVMAGLPTYNNLLSFFGEKTAGMTGNLKEYFLSKYTTAVQEKWKNLQKDKETLEEKTKKIMGSSFEELGDLSAKIGATISFWDGEAVRERELSYGQMMYIYMVNKMTDGAMKLRSMGISEEMVNTIEGMLPKKLVEMADWIQGDFLPQMRGRFNVVHQRMFGASMDEVENYFPLVINKGSRRENVDVSSMIPTTPSTITGSIIKRRVNTAAIDINANALDVLMRHLEEMEQWAAFGEFIKDNNILLSDTDFKNRVKNMKSVRYGDGEDILEAFKECAQLATGTHRAKGNELSVNLARGLNSGKIAFGYYTALKQFLSQPAVLADAGVMDVVKAVTSPFEAWRWAAENVPGFEERWKGRTAGIETFEKTDKDWGLWDNKTMKKIRNLGMTPNAFVDAAVVAVNAKAVYDSRMKFYSSIGFDKAVANKRALHDAAVSYNETQQSGLGAFVSPMQADRTFLGMLLTLFRNSQIGYQRRLINAVKGIANRVNAYDELRANTVEKYKKMGLDDKKADEAAQRDMNVSLAKDAMSVVLFGYVLNLLWALGEDAIYLLFGDDEEEKDRVMKENAVVAFSGLFEGLTLGGQAKEVMTRLYRGENVRDLGILTTPLETDWNKVFQKFQNEGWLSGAYQLVMTSTESLTGISPQRLIDDYAAVVDVCKGDLEMSRRVMLFVTRLMKVPQSQIDKVYQDWAMSEDDEELLKMAKRYVDYKMNRENPLDKDNPELRLKKLNRFDEAVMERITAGVESAQDIELVYDRVSPKYKDKLRRMWNSLTDEEAKDSATVNAELVDDFEKKMRGLVDFKVYDSLETMDDLRDDRFLKEIEAMGMPANTKKKNGGALSDEELRLWRLYKIASKTRSSVNELKRLMDKRPEDAEKMMMRVRMLRAKAMNLIEGYNE